MDKDVLAVTALTASNKGAQQLQPGAAKIINKPRRKNVEAVVYEKANRNTKITFVIMGMWTSMMPPYNLARLTALTRSAGFKTTAIDYNIQSYHYMKMENEELANAWDVSSYWWWQKGSYWDKVFPYYKDILDDYIDELCDMDHNVLGFSLYEPNELSTNYVAEQIKARRPDITILYGGPECMEVRFKKPDYVDHYFIGETEGALLGFLEDFEKGITPKGTGPIGVMFGTKRIDLDELPFPDYTDFPMDMYTNKDIVCTELSRGCVARCTYCTEVFYWKFRDRDAIRVVEELQYQYDVYGTKFVYFADSLMNGNIKEFRRFCEEMAERNRTGQIEMKWWGYARANAKMDDEFYKLMKEAGAQGFNYGFETGSDKVLLAINKKNTVADINSNILSAHKYGIKTSGCWVTGAPGEFIEDWAMSLNLFWNHRYRLYSIAPGIGLGDSYGSAYDDRKKFNMNHRDCQWFGGWWTLDKKNTAVHRFLRTKEVHIWLDICNKFMPEGEEVENSYSYGSIDKHYKVNFKEDKIVEDLLYEFDFNYEIIKTELGPFADSLMNEIFAMLRVLWRVKGAYDIEINWNPELDSKDFGASLFESWDYTSTVKFCIDKNGNYTIRNEYNFVDNNKKLEANAHLGHGNEDPENRPIDYDASWDYTYESSGKW